MFGFNKQEQKQIEQEVIYPQAGTKCILITTRIKRLPLHLYYVGTDSEGYLTLCQTPFGNGKAKLGRTYKKIRKRKDHGKEQDSVMQQPNELKTSSNN